MIAPEQITLAQWDSHYRKLQREGLSEPTYGGPLSRHLADGDVRLPKLKYDNSAAALDLWNFLLTEEDRLHQAKADGLKLVGTMKDLGTVPVMAYSCSNLVAFYPDGAWWIPCIMELSAGLLEIADSLGVDESFCPVRAMLGAFVTEAHFPVPDLLTCSVGAVCDDFSAIAQRLNGLGYPILWWEIPHRRAPEAGEEAVTLPGGVQAPMEQVAFVRAELGRVRDSLADLAGTELDDTKLSAGIEKANEVRRCLRELRRLTFASQICPLPAFELLIAEMLAIHFCSDLAESLRVLTGLLTEVRARTRAGIGFGNLQCVRIYWVNPVADIRVMNLLEECGGRICGTEYLFTHALDDIPTNQPPLDSLAMAALADPMVGSTVDRARRICKDAAALGAEGLVLSRIPGASHCAAEGTIIHDVVARELGIPVVEIEVSPVSDGARSGLATRIGALIEMARDRRVR